MIRPAGPLKPSDLTPNVSCATVCCPPGEQVSAYGPQFWLAYSSNLLVMIAIAMLYRYADFVIHLGGGEWHLGWIVGLGMVGSLAVRLAMGQAIDKYGSRLIWLGSIAVFALVCFAHVWVTSHNGLAIYLLRVAFCCSIAGIFGASMTFVSSRVSVVRLAEMWGMLGTAGFVGILVGPLVSDWMLGSELVTRQQLDRMFIVAGLFVSGSAGFAYLAARGEQPRPRHVQPPLMYLLRRYHPGSILLVGVVMGIGLGLPNTFLRTFAAELAIPRIGVFFSFYAPAAIITRILTRRASERFGPERLILVGVVGLLISQLLFLLVQTEWQFLLPGIGYGVSHAVLFPCVVAAGSSAFPDEHRGVGNLLILAMYDLGVLVGAPMVGIGVEVARLLGLAPYPTVFLALAVVLGGTAVFYRLTWRRGRGPWEHLRQPHSLAMRVESRRERVIGIATRD
ncbi:MAG: MFS transporter [Patescibacteria group bacterium]|nr:MFS transporter [Patescibacteria group bacterium]